LDDYASRDDVAAAIRRLRAHSDDTEVVEACDQYLVELKMLDDGKDPEVRFDWDGTSVVSELLMQSGVCRKTDMTTSRTCRVSGAGAPGARERPDHARPLRAPDARVVTK
jgi:hypothetical protein